MTTPEQAAEAYCDQPRCAQMTRDDKAWHRTKAAFLAGIAYRDQNPSESVKEFINAFTAWHWGTNEKWLRLLRAFHSCREQAGKVTNEKA